MKNIENLKVFLGFWAAHRPPVAKNVCFSVFLSHMFPKPYVFHVFGVSNVFDVFMFFGVFAVSDVFDVFGVCDVSDVSDVFVFLWCFRCF